MRLKILGYLSHLYYIKNDMNSMYETLTESVSILNALLRVYIINIIERRLFGNRNYVA